MSAQNERFLTDDQVHALNEKHGWFKFGDAQSDVSRAFAQDAIAMHERIRNAAPDLLEALNNILVGMEASGGWEGDDELFNAGVAAYKKATEAKP
ncbi:MULTISPECIES: hypothetical protein [unclassified Polaromonas]|jgi:hypothetical protein|uniref:hypothetical protein n=1 Tax=unclassified Polaromonas TaxID=2638319 RepID=UPI000BD676C4|nr:MULTISPECIES: hypothetical protein [unclassified Polaromonas]OYY34753.1 MAG: hypothetical protein B7Y60_15030 [Polaromonas sp. 35-63-35]OYZ19362.1 MAG: hypothetical protein B7Y28_12560 [Polaromonas sp. 16-63-31]OZA48503.1 MAG: hypothetical protein B7X88_18330 [Polaromonas sp. 17-63-33]HQR98121.1 hypothetical protein [Polaromonas sp.]HQS38827.1 hypothetical protein [Polaromonas sp.]